MINMQIFAQPNYGGIAMDDLMNCLYEFVQTRRMGSLHDDEEYKEYTKSAKLQENGFRST